MVKLVRYGHPNKGIPMYVISMFRTEHRSWKVDVTVCDNYGTAISAPVFWDIFPCWWDAHKCVGKQYKEFYKYVNERR